MKPLDPRLIRYVSSARRYIIAVAAMGVLAAILVLIQTIAISTIISPIINETSTWQDLLLSPLPLIVLGVVVVARVGAIYARETIGHSSANRIITDLRAQLLDAASRLGPRWLAQNATDTATLSTRGLDALVPYFVRYLPQLLLSMTVTPMALVVMLWFDWWSALIAVGSIPLIPIFMILVGKLTQQFSDKKIAVMENLGSQVLDLLSGLVTMKALGREKGPEKTIKTLGDRYNESTMATLRLAFLSGAILEFIATLSVALVAVEVGMRLVFGSIDLYAGLIVIMLAPEVYNPLRNVGVQFHASSDGVAAVNQAFEVIEAGRQMPGLVSSPSLTDASFVISGASVKARGRMSPDNVNATIAPHSITALKGPSGIGKTTLAMALMGFQKLDKGSITIRNGSETVDLSSIDPTSLQEQIMWVPQIPVILPGTVLESLLPEATEPSEELLAAAAATGFDEIVNTMPNQWHTVLGHNAVGLSVGQRQRLALTRALLQHRPVVILDEPTAHLDSLSERQIIAVIKKLHSMGSTIIVIAHREAVVELADNHITLKSRVLEKAEIASEEVALTAVDNGVTDEIDTFFTQGDAK
ncbi:thiol reductant ABC exporter subunit CydD [Boudabousia marimammalium]|uniref:Thiol reductant ABC exporter subunit CydD n=1 Tax=Boudabousia marimammalium TaxID=156892 RepID=A0A1Q5PRB5_9ACTO|nr:thiol reductant ABC exporter subunit CydD [Boudabousia marimammalium]OKL50086.1 thiol reductant ABC exporter subunit CydD [Boudabousia marimammalium]